VNPTTLLEKKIIQLARSNDTTDGYVTSWTTFDPTSFRNDGSVSKTFQCLSVFLCQGQKSSQMKAQT